jgi:hypothetical protein
MPLNRTKGGFFSDETPNGSLMYWTVEHVKASRYVRVVTGGVYNIDDHMRMLEDVVNRDFWKPGMNLLIDDSRLDFHQTSLEQLREAGLKRLRFDPLIGGGKTAVIVDSLADFARVRQYELITSGKVAAKIDIFKDEDKAVLWLLA